MINDFRFEVDNMTVVSDIGWISGQ